MRQNLVAVKNEVRGGVLVFSAALRKNFARKPAYWVEVYRVQRGPSNVYVVAKQWGFVKSEGEKVQDSSCSKAIPNIKSAMKYVGKVLQAKVDAGWMMCEEEFNASPPSVNPQGDENQIIMLFCQDWENGLGIKQATQTKKRITKQKPKTPAEKFKDAQQKRKAKAEW